MVHRNFKSSCLLVDKEKMCLTQYGGVVPHLWVGVLEVVDEDRCEASHHPDGDVEQEKWEKAQKLPCKSSLFPHHSFSSYSPPLYKVSQIQLMAVKADIL